MGFVFNWSFTSSITSFLKLSGYFLRLWYPCFSSPWWNSLYTSLFSLSPRVGVLLGKSFCLISTAEGFLFKSSSGTTIFLYLFFSSSFIVFGFFLKQRGVVWIVFDVFSDMAKEGRGRKDLPEEEREEQKWCADRQHTLLALFRCSTDISERWNIYCSHEDDRLINLLERF